MRKTDALFQLIKSLTSTEKRYLTLEARKAGRGESRYWRLYQVMNKQEVYDETALSKSLKGKLADDKNRLYEAILRAMRNYRSQLSRAARIKEHLLDSDFLYDRGLYDQAYERLRIARELATELDDQLARLEVNKEIRRVANTLLARQETEELSSLIEEKTELIGNLERELQVLDLHDEIIRAVQAARSGNQEADRQELLKQYGAVLFEASPPSSIQGALRYYQSRGLLGRLLADSKMVYENYQHVIRIWEQQPAYKEEEFNRYLDDAFNLLSSTFQYPAALPEALPLLQQLEAEAPASAHDRMVLFQRTATYRLVYYINNDNQRPAAEVLAPIAAGLEQYQLNPISEMTIRFNAAVLLFLQDEWEACEGWLVGIIDLRRNDLRPDILVASRLLRLTTLLDQELPFEFFENQIRAEYRFLLKQNPDRLVDFGRFWLRSLRQVGQAPSTSARKSIEKQELVAFEADWNGLPLGLDELLKGWLRAKISGASVVESLK